MNQEPFIGAYWVAREETHQECVTRTLRFLQEISADPGLTKWCIPEESNTPQELSMEAIGKRMKPIWNRCIGIPDPQLTDKLGFSFLLCNGDDNARVGLSIHCGSQKSAPPNSVALDLPSQPFPGDQESIDRFKRLLDIFVKNWDPEYALVTSKTRMERFNIFTESAWLLYRKGKPLFIDTSV